MMTMEATKAFTSTEVYFPFLYFQFSIVSESCGGSETKQDNGKVRCYNAKLIADICHALVISFIFLPIHFLSVRVC